MSRAVLGVLALAAVAAQAQDSYLPLAPGNRWVYAKAEDVRAGAVKTTRSGKAELHCIERAHHKVANTFVLGWKGHSERLLVSVSDDAISVLRNTEDRFLLPANFAQPEADAKRIRIGDLVAEAYRVGAAITVETPAGSYEAVPVSATLRNVATKVTLTVWYARGVGPVKFVQDVQAADTRVLRTLLLESTSLGEGQPIPLEVEEPTPLVEEPTPLVEAPEAPNPPAVSLPKGLSLAKLVAAGPQADLREVLSRIRALKSSISEVTGAEVNGTIPDAPLSSQAQRRVVGAELRHQRIACTALTVTGTLRHCLVICDGDVTITGDVRHSIILASGKVTLAGELRHSLLVSKGKLLVSGELRHSAAVTHGAIRLSGSVKFGSLEAAETAGSGEAERTTFFNGPALPGRGNESQSTSPTLREQFRIE